jgi:outer membrane receptor protein involved in Fe transport
MWKASTTYHTYRWLADIPVGGNFKRYVLNSEGTLFADSAGTIGINEYGAYVQASRALLNERVRLTLSGRYDKNQNFEGRFTPRATALVNWRTTTTCGFPIKPPIAFRLRSSNGLI